MFCWIVPSKNNVEPAEEVDFNLLFLKTFCAKHRCVISLRDTYRSNSFQGKPILSRPKFNFAYKKNLQARSHETMNHTKENHLFNEPWNVRSKEFVIAVTLLGKWHMYIIWVLNQIILPLLNILFAYLLIDLRVKILKCFQVTVEWGVWVHWVPPGLL